MVCGQESIPIKFDRRPNDDVAFEMAGAYSRGSGLQFPQFLAFESAGAGLRIMCKCEPADHSQIGYIKQGRRVEGHRSDPKLALKQNTRDREQGEKPSPPQVLGKIVKRSNHRESHSFYHAIGWLDAPLVAAETERLRVHLGMEFTWG